MIRILIILVISICACNISVAATERSLSAQVHAQIVKAQEVLKADKPDRALDILRRLSKKQNLTQFEKATVLYFEGFALMRSDKVKGAVLSFEKAFASGVLSKNTKIAIAQNLARIFLSDSDIKASVKYADFLEKSHKNKSTKDYTFLAKVYDKDGQHKRAVRFVELAIKETKASEATELYIYLLALYLKQEEFDKALKVSEKAAILYPANTYFSRQSAALASKLGYEGKLLKRLSTLYRLGKLNSEQEVVLLANIYMKRGAPFRAAKLLEAERKKYSDAGRAYTVLLAQAWHQAGEWEKAEAELLTLSEKERDRTVALLLADIYGRQNKWEEAIRIYRRIKNKSGDIWLKLGIAYARAHMTEKATAAFLKAKQFKEHEAAAVNWLKFVSAGS